MEISILHNNDSSILSTETYDTFKASLAQSNCSKCSLSTSRTNIVVDRGMSDASVMMIGEAPGANEDLQGKAFVGRSGRLLDKLLGEMGFDTNKDSIIANVVKCRPPQNRVPSKEEIEACKPYLNKQLSLIKPKII